MNDKRDYYKFIVGKTLKEKTRIPTYDEILERQWKQLNSHHSLFSLGIGTEGELWLSEEERENHLHIIGTTGEGKSRFLELLIRHDIDQGNGLLFLDPSSGAETAYNILKYCALKGRDKVILIDPGHRWKFNKVVGLNPFFHIKDNKPMVSLETPCISNVFDTVKVIFNTKDEAETPLINKILPAILHVLYKSGMTLYEALYFTDMHNPIYRAKREHIFGFSHSQDRYRVALEELFYNPFLNANLQSTVRRFEPLFHDILSLMLARTGLDFAKLVSEKYIVLVNLSSFHMQPIHNRLLGTLLINELDFAVDRLKEYGWKGVYYLYIDEAAEYSTRKLAHLLMYKRKNGLRVNLAHQYFSQFEDRFVLEAVKSLTKTKIAFHIPNPNDRMEIVKAMYGGELGDREVAYSLGQLKKQNAVIKKGKDAPAIVKIPDVSDVEISRQALKDYIEEIYKQPFYFTPEQVREEINARFKDIVPKGVFTVSSRKGAESKHRPANKIDGTKKEHRPKGSKQSKEEKPGQSVPSRNVDELFLEAERLEESE